MGSTQPGTVEGTGFIPPSRHEVQEDMEDPAKWAAQSQVQLRVQGSYPPCRQEVQEEREDPTRWAA